MFYSLFYELVSQIPDIYDALEASLTKFGFIFVISLSGGIKIAEYLVYYGLRSAALFKMAKRQNLNNAWLAFLPCACFFLLGKLQDDTTPFSRRNKRWQYCALVFSSLWLVIAVLLDVFGSVPTLMNVLALADTEPVTTDVLVVNNLTRMLNLVGGLFSLVFLISSVILYLNVFRAYAPEKSMKYSIISVIVDVIFDTPLFYAIFLFRLRDREKVGYARYAAARADFYRNPYGYGNQGNGGYGAYGENRNSAEKKPEEPFEEFSSDDEPFTDGNGDSFGGNGGYDNRGNGGNYTDRGDDGDDLFS